MLFNRKKYIAGFFGEDSLRVAEIGQRDGKFSVLREKAYSLMPDASGTLVPSCRTEFGESLRLVVSEEGLYTFSGTVPVTAMATREAMRKELASYFPESSESTMWDSKIISSDPKQVVLEVTELKHAWADRLLTVSREMTLSFESIIPESSALAFLVDQEGPVMILHRKSESAVLFLCAESGEVSASMLFRNPPSSEDVSDFLRFCKEKKQKEPKKIICSGFDEDMLKTLSFPVAMNTKTLDPLLAVASVHPHRKEQGILDLVDALPKKTFLQKLLFWK